MKIFEAILASLMLLLACPLFFVIACFIWCETGGPVFFRQKRIGKNGQAFTFIKFRSMKKNAQKEKISWRLENPKLWQEYCQNNFRLKNDYRVTKVGKILRKSSLDELPQLINIVKGEMSFVGPRPILLRERVAYGKYLHLYQQMRPGITGLWQVSGRSKTSFRRRIACDILQKRRQGLRLYFYILLKTILVVFHLNKAH